MQEQLLEELSQKFTRATQALKSELQGIRSGRPMPQLIEDVKVAYGTQQLLLKQVGHIGIRPPREIYVTVWDAAMVEAVAKAVAQAQQGVSVTHEGNTVRIFLPPLSEERRRELGKLVKKHAEATKIQLRAARDEARKKLKNLEEEKQISQDAAFRLKEKMQDAIESANKEIENLVARKLQELQE
ncbi:ribosome recycling factor [Candidatus Parcubacteria bacterium]|nr:MAG: ribosome recycling factor [Candidatus Parcubacteria bacterium]